MKTADFFLILMLIFLAALIGGMVFWLRSIWHTPTSKRLLVMHPGQSLMLLSILGIQFCIRFSQPAPDKMTGSFYCFAFGWLLMFSAIFSNSIVSWRLTRKLPVEALSEENEIRGFRNGILYCFVFVFLLMLSLIAVSWLKGWH